MTGMGWVFASLAVDEPGRDAMRSEPDVCPACEHDDCGECETYGLSPEAACCCGGLTATNERNPA